MLRHMCDIDPATPADHIGVVIQVDDWSGKIDLSAAAYGQMMTLMEPYMSAGQVDPDGDVISPALGSYEAELRSALVDHPRFAEGVEEVEADAEKLSPFGPLLGPAVSGELQGVRLHNYKNTRYPGIVFFAKAKGLKYRNVATKKVVPWQGVGHVPKEIREAYEAAIADGSYIP